VSLEPITRAGCDQPANLGGIPVKSRKLVPVARFMRDNLRAALWQPVADARDRRGRRYAWLGLLNLLLLGMCVSARTLRDVERLGGQLVVRRSFGLGGAPSDTLLESVVRTLVPDTLRQVIRTQVLALHRSKRMEVDPAIGLSLVAIDGKCIGADRVRKHPSSTAMTPARRIQGAKRSPRGAKAVKAGRENLSVPDMPPGPDGKVHLVKVLRAVHVGSRVKPALDQLVLPEGRGESPLLRQFVRELVSAYGRSIVECISLDAAFAGQGNLEWLAVTGMDYIVAIKGNAGNLSRWLRKRMGGDSEEAPLGGWQVESQERRGGAIHRRRFARLLEHGDIWGGDYRQVWRVRQTVEREGVTTAVDDRLFITSLPGDRLTAAQCMAAIRAHWGIENDSNWSLDVAWREDTSAWVKMGVSRESLAVLRLLAYNLVRVLRHRVLKGPPKGHIPYRELFERIRDALVSPAALHAAGGL
jgi:predicted transposase YbfD/YdcC